MKIQVWAPGMNPSDGGIQAYSWEVYQALREILGKDNVRAISIQGIPSTDSHVNEFSKYPPRLRNPIFALTCIVRAIREKPDYLLLTHVNLCPVARLVQKFRSIPYGVSMHGLELWQLHDISKRQALLQAKQVFPVSKWTRSAVVEQFPQLVNRCTVLANTFDAEKFPLGPKPAELLRRYNLSPDAKIILTVARLSAQERYKGIDEIIQALPKVLSQVENCHYLVVGKGDDLDRLRRDAEQAGVEDRVIFCGFIPAEELSAHYQLCDVYAMPSRGEGFGITYLEALASGKPALAGKMDASREALLEGNLGVLVNSDRPDEIADGLISLLNKTHPNQQLFDPQWLREEVIRAYGRAEFSRNLQKALNID
ncbi:MAG: glycosyltransferase family 4 protein [Chthoniobacterales bacterium]